MKSILIIGSQTSFITEAIEICESAGFTDIYCVDNLNQTKTKTLEQYPLFHLDQIGHDFPVRNYIICPHTPLFKERIVKNLQPLNLNPITVIHKSAVISSRAKISPHGVIIGAGAVIGSHTEVGDFALINRGALIGHDIKIGKYASVESGVVLGGFSQIGKKSYIGMNASILPKVEIGDNSVVGAGSVVMEDIPANTLAAGVPAKILKIGIKGYLPK